MKIMKRIISALLSVIMLAVGIPAFAGEKETPVEIKAKSAVLMDASTGQVLMAYNENEKVYPASVTKIMPLLLICAV